MITVLDIETSVDFESKNRVSSPFFGQQIVFVGTQTFIPKQYLEEKQLFFFHEEVEPTHGGVDTLQDVLDRTTCLVGHNLKFDLQWLRACGFIYNRSLFDTMIAEYLLARSTKVALSLAQCCLRRGLPQKRGDMTEDYLNNKVSFENIPPSIVSEYCMNDVRITEQLASQQIIEFNRSWNYYIPSLKEGAVYAKCA